MLLLSSACVLCCVSKSHSESTANVCDDKKTIKSEFGINRFFYIIPYVTNYSFILARNFSDNL